MDNKKYLLSSVTHALEILDLLGEKESLSATEISKLLGQGKSSVFRLLYTLESKGYVHKCQNAKYILSSKFTYLGSIVAGRQNEFPLAKPELINLRDKLNETVHMSILLPNYNIMFIDKVNSNRSLQMQSTIGHQLPSYCTGMGKVFLADLLGTEEEAEIRKLPLVRQTATTITDPEKLIQELQEIKLQGYSVDNEESEEGLTCFAVPIQNHLGRVIAAISISGQSQRMTENRDYYLSSLKESASVIEQLLGC